MCSASLCGKGEQGPALAAFPSLDWLQGRGGWVGMAHSVCQVEEMIQVPDSSTPCSFSLICGCALWGAFGQKDYPLFLDKNVFP